RQCLRPSASLVDEVRQVGRLVLSRGRPNIIRRLNGKPYIRTTASYQPPPQPTVKVTAIPEVDERKRPNRLQCFLPLQLLPEVCHYDVVWLGGRLEVYLFCALD